MNQIHPNITAILSYVDQVINTSKSREVILQNISKLLNNEISHYNWVGFYLVDDAGENLLLGPYVGASTDHIKIAFGKGLCGQVAISETSRIIQDVALEDNYLSCSSNVRSELVFPIMKNGKFVAELDIDSHALAPFTDQDTELLEAVCHKLEILF